jgi:hypothetical protein
LGKLCFAIGVLGFVAEVEVVDWLRFWLEGWCCFELGSWFVELAEGMLFVEMGEGMLSVALVKVAGD